MGAPRPSQDCQMLRHLKPRLHALHLSLVIFGFRQPCSEHIKIDLQVGRKYPVINLDLVTAFWAEVGISLCLSCRLSRTFAGIMGSGTRGGSDGLKFRWWCKTSGPMVTVYRNKSPCWDRIFFFLNKGTYISFINFKFNKFYQASPRHSSNFCLSLGCELDNFTQLSPSAAPAPAVSADALLAAGGVRPQRSCTAWVGTPSRYATKENFFLAIGCRKMLLFWGWICEFQF